MTRFVQAVGLIVLVYIALQLVYLQRLPLIMDEFDGAYDVYRLRQDVPYRDYIPYKTVLGYYLQLPATFLASTVWGRLIALKLELIIINAGMMIAAAFYCRRFLSQSAVALALALLAASTPMMERAAEIRVDMLTGWAGLWALLFLLRHRYALSGLCCAASFAISQKAALYVIATAAVFASALIFRDYRRQALRGAVVFAAAAAGGLVVYVGFWSLLADPIVVLRSTFLSASQVAMSAAYDIQWRFWSQVLMRNVVIFMVTAAALWALLRVEAASHAWHRWAVTVYTAVLLAQSAMYTQPWPYFFVILFPALFILMAVFFDHLERVGFRKMVLVAVAIAGILFPLYRVLVLVRHDNDYQRYNVALASALLNRDDTYMAFNDVVHDREQTLRSLARLDAISLHILANESSSTHAQIIQALDRKPAKLVIRTFRLNHLPPVIRSYIGQTYARLSGSIWLYAPLVSPGDQKINLRFPGRYRLELQAGEQALVDGRVTPDGTMLELPAGFHQVTAPSAFRLRFLPAALEELIDPHYASERAFFTHVYD